MTHDQFCILLILSRMGTRSRDSLFAALNFGRDADEEIAGAILYVELQDLVISGYIAEPSEGYYQITLAGDAAMCRVMPSI